MKSKLFKIHLDESGSFEEVKFNKFLEGVTVNKIFASVVNNEFWTTLVFYDDGAATVENPIERETFTEKDEIVNPLPSSPPEKIVLSPDQEALYSALRRWRNEKASYDGLPPYMIAHNDSLIQMATTPVNSKEDLVQIKGFGEKRVEKYGDEILEILNNQNQSAA